MSALYRRPLVAGRCARALALAFALVCVGVALVGAAPALAFRGHVYEKSFGKAGSGDGELEQPSGVAVNEATGEVYVVDRGNDRVQIFRMNGGNEEYAGQFDGSGELSGEGKAAGSGGLAGEVATGRFDEPSEIAVDNSCHYQGLTGKECEKADPSNGDVYVVDEGHFVVDKFTATGEYVGQITQSVQDGKTDRFEYELASVAVGPDGDVYVSALLKGEPAEERVFEFSNVVHDGCDTCQVSELNPSGPLTGLTGFLGKGLAVDSEGDVYFTLFKLASPSLVVEYSPSGEVVRQVAEAPPRSSVGLGVEDATGELYVGSGADVARYSASGGLIERYGREGLDGGGLAVDGVSSQVFVSDVSGGVVDVFGLEPPGPPTIESESVSKVTSDSAVFDAELNPRGAAAGYRVAYGMCSSPDACASSGFEDSVPAVEGVTGGDFEVHDLSVAAQGLLPDRTYHYRFVAHNETLDSENQDRENVVEGEAGTFTTQPQGGELVLPDGRAWELVSPPDQYGAKIAAIGENGVIEAAADGDAFTFLTSVPTETDPAGNANAVQVFAKRGAGGGWSARDIVSPHEAPTGKSVGLGEEYRFFSEDLSEGIVEPFGSFDRLSPGASEQTPYVREDFGSGTDGLCGEDCYRPLVTGCPEAGEPCAKAVEEQADVPAGTVFSVTGETCETEKFCGPRAVAASGDLSAVLLYSDVGLSEGTSGGLYEWVGGRLYPIGPGAPEEAAWVGSGGSRVVYGQANGSVPLRLVDPLSGDGVELDAKESGCGGCESGGGETPWVARDGSRVFFRDKHALTSGSDSGTEAEDLYVCEVPSGGVACGLTDLTPKPASGHTDVLGIVGISEDGSTVYFVANGALTEGAVKGNCPTSTSESAVVGEECNLYALSRSGSGWGQPRLVAALSGADRSDWEADLEHHPSSVSGNGEWLAFMSDRSLTGYDNSDAVSGQPDEEVYLYHAAGDGSLVCASCDPTGARPDGVEYEKLGPLASGDRVWPAAQWVAANVPGWTPFELAASQYDSRYLSNEGRLFFDSSDALVPQDVDGTEDVYEYEPTGLGSCEAESSTFSERAGGCVSLISSGNSSQESAFLDASANGGDVFFATAAKLSPEDRDNAYDVYDAHVCSESAPCPAPPPVSPPPCTTADACRAAPTPQPSIFGAPSSATFVGEGNVAASPPKPTTTTAVVKAKAKVSTRAQRLARALRACRKRPKRERATCEKRARKRYRAR